MPKPLLEVAGEPFLRHQLRLLAAHGAREVVICVGYLGALIEECIGYRQFGIDIEYSYDGARPLGTLGAIRKASSLLGPQFLVLYGDTYLRLNYRTAVEAWDKSGLPAMMTVLRNEGRWDVSNASFDGTFVTAYDKLSPVSKMQYIDYGLGGLRDNALELTESQSTDLSDLYQGLAKRRLLFGFEATERFYEIGTPIALAETSAFMAGLRRNATIRSTPPKLNDDA